ncbi:MAG: formylglycine-generating enzyme family protein [Pirellulales bacterium]|nr:formylglycine-generating enzyme family protein [Pirellulales bacterium]
MKLPPLILTTPLWLIVGGGIAAMGAVLFNPYLFGVGAVACVCSTGAAWLQKQRGRKLSVLPGPPVDNSPAAVESHFQSAPPESVPDLIQQLLHDGRAALLLRPQLAADLEPAQIEQAREQLLLDMALIPGGRVNLHWMAESDGGPDHPPSVDLRGQSVAPFFLDRTPVTNRQYLAFVQAGGYAQVSLWEAEVLPAVVEFVDITGQPGPRYWIDGCYPKGTGDQPVVGISWHEAQAYARWVGKRLPTDAEWVKAAAWPVPVAGNRLKQRRYPWGDAMERGRANLWELGLGKIAAVHEFSGGSTINGIQQLIGNVWEWTDGEFRAARIAGLDDGAERLRSVRGGAFDTYFEHQASSEFASGESALARKHNIGFRCALGWQGIQIGEDLVPPESALTDAAAPRAAEEQADIMPPQEEPPELIHSAQAETQALERLETSPGTSTELPPPRGKKTGESSAWNWGRGSDSGACAVVGRSVGNSSDDY